MKKILTISIIMILGFFSCKNSETENQLIQKEIELSEKEKELTAETKKLELQQKHFELQAEVQNSIIHCENKNFIVKVDNLKNGDIRYISWNKPKIISDEPDLVLYDGKIDVEGTAGYHYIFSHGEWNYIVENNFMGENFESMGVFLRLSKNDQKRLYSKMTDLTHEGDYDLKSYSRENLIGNWWTLNYAVRKINFYKNGTFSFDNGDGKQFNGNYELMGKSVILSFDNGLDKIVEIGGGYDNSSLTLTGGGENFVKEYKE